MLRKILEHLRRKRTIKQIKKLESDILRARSLMQDAENVLRKLNYPRWKRKQFWRDFHKSGDFRKELFDEVVKYKGIEQVNLPSD